jgi:AmmeMemoRadiSam system protein A
MPLAEGVAHNAFDAAFADRRFRPFDASERSGLTLSVSILSHPRPLAFRSEVELAAALQPDVDGVILEADGRRGLFLPQVWAMIPDPREWLRQLKMKAGLAPDFWSPGVRAWRFRTEGFGAAYAGGAASLAAIIG